MVEEQIEGIKQVGATVPGIIGLFGSFAYVSVSTLQGLEVQENRFHFVALLQTWPHVPLRLQIFLYFTDFDFCSYLRIGYLKPSPPRL